MSRTAQVRLAHLPCPLASIVSILSGHGQGRRQLCTVWYAVPTPHARVGGSPSAPKPHGPAAGPVGVWGGTCGAGLASAAVPGPWSVPQLRAA